MNHPWLFLLLGLWLPMTGRASDPLFDNWSSPSSIGTNPNWILVDDTKTEDLTFDNAFDFEGLFLQMSVNGTSSLGYAFTNRSGKTLVGFQGDVRVTDELGEVILQERLRCTASQNKLNGFNGGGDPFRVPTGETFIIVKFSGDYRAGFSPETFALTMDYFNQNKDGIFQETSLKEGLKIVFLPQILAFDDGTVLKVQE